MNESGKAPVKECLLTKSRFGFFVMGANLQRQHRINYEISSPRIHLIGKGGESYGVVGIEEALKISSQQNLDLVEIAPKANPPVVKLLDYNKFRYEQEKRARLSARGVKNPRLKEVRLSYGISQHDLEIKTRQIREFLADGNFVRIYILLKGRQNLFPENAKEVLYRCKELSQGEVEQDISMLAKKVSMVIKPRKNDVKTNKDA